MVGGQALLCEGRRPLGAKGGEGAVDPQAAKGAPEALRSPSETFGGVDVRGSTKQELLERARAVDVQGRSRTSKEELARAVARNGR